MTLSTNEMSITFLALALLILSSFVFGKIFEKINTPKVVGEIVGGMVFGGSSLGLLMPEMTDSIFNYYAEEGKVLTISFLVILSCVFSMSFLNINIMYSAFISGYIMKSYVVR